MKLLDFQTTLATPCHPKASPVATFDMAFHHGRLYRRDEAVQKNGLNVAIRGCQSMLHVHVQICPVNVQKLPVRPLIKSVAMGSGQLFFPLFKARVSIGPRISSWLAMLGTLLSMLSSQSVELRLFQNGCQQGSLVLQRISKVWGQIWVPTKHAHVFYIPTIFIYTSRIIEPVCLSYPYAFMDFQEFSVGEMWCLKTFWPPRSVYAQRAQRWPSPAATVDQPQTRGMSGSLSVVSSTMDSHDMLWHDCRIWKLTMFVGWFRDLLNYFNVDSKSKLFALPGKTIKTLYDSFISP